MKKYDLILNALEALIIEDRGETCSVSEIARKAGIGKGSIYYYFKSKEEIMDALVERNYQRIIDGCKDKLAHVQCDAIEKLKVLFGTYLSGEVGIAVDKYLHELKNAAIHQKSLAKILSALSPIISEIIEQGIEEQLFVTDYPTEVAEIIMSVFGFLMDPGIFNWTEAEVVRKMQALSDVVEKALRAPKGSFAFLVSPIVAKQL